MVEETFYKREVSVGLAPVLAVNTTKAIEHTGKSRLGSRNLQQSTRAITARLFEDKKMQHIWTKKIRRITANMQ